MSEMSSSTRYHGFDSLRASMMFLGLVLHTAINYMTIRAGWPFHDAANHVVFDVMVVFIHIFRMPVFYVAAGFFGALLWMRRGSGLFVNNRLKRILVPFLFGWLLLFPLTRSGEYFAVQGGDLSAFDGAIEHILSGALWREGFSTLHLWFLYYLLMFYGLTLGIIYMSRQLPGVAGLIRRFFERVITSTFAPILFAFPTWFSMFWMSSGTMEVSNSFVPRADILAVYGSFFMFGWLLYEHRGMLNDIFAHKAWTYLGIGLLMSAVYMGTFVARLQGAEIPHLLVIGLSSLSAWHLVYGVTGLFLRYLNQSSALWRYLCDASYWVYLAHMPLALWVPGLLQNLALSVFVKFLISLSLITFITMVTYHWLVRPTWVGQILNGRKIPLRKKAAYIKDEAAQLST